MRQALRLIWLVCLLLATPVLAQTIMERLVTPGPLASGHAKLESRCDSCHSSFRKEAQNAKCTKCHSGVGQDISTRTRYHGKYSPARTGTCKSCHSEHKGRGYALIRLDRAGFNHDLTDYPLEGKHASVSCTSCHGKGSNYRGVTKICASCHKRDDPHGGKLGVKCQTCHSAAGWKQIRPFDHTTTGFTLSGAHRQAGCTACHTGQRWKGLGSTCISCHTSDDAHRGSRGKNCAGCHTTGAWRTVTFDHGSTGFPLTGGHAAASCAGCHGSGNSIKKPARGCNACHASDDIHEGHNGTDCSSCHNSRSWTQVSFDHDRLTKFPLKGAHRDTTCESCHSQPPKVAKPPVTCFGCHAADDTHMGRNGQDCERCHTEASWKEVNFNHDTMTRFPLAGQHAKAPCEACHTSAPATLKLSLDCGSCHQKDDAHAGHLGNNCSRCHNSESWKESVRFDHGLTRFPLLGKHAQLECKGCHIDGSFSAKGATCASCHADDHHRGGLGAPSACGDCHNTLDWKAWSFDHDAQSDFPLTGQHKGLVCSACHSQPGDPAETGSRCISCHRRNDIHRGGFGEDCERCHVSSSFSEIKFPGRQ